MTPLPNDQILTREPPPPPLLTPSRVLPVCDNCHNASTIFKDSNKTLGPRLEKLCSRSLKNNKGPDQPVHRCRLVSAFVIISSVAFLMHFIEYALLRGQGGCPLYGSMGEAMWQKMVFVQFKGLKEALKHAKTRS